MGWQCRIRFDSVDNLGRANTATHTPAAGSAQTYGYDALQRLSTVSGGAYTKTYNYRNISDTRTTTQVSSLVYSGNVSQTYSYTYDALGNIATYTAPGKAAFTYTYDNQGQLTKATNGTTTYNYSYDTVGNITAANGHSYTYGNTNWRDLLTAYDGQSITYDASGNPTSYYNGTRWTMAWEEGRRLISASGGGNSITYAYDSEGLRLSKTVGTTQHNYYYAGGKLMRETYGGNTLDFFYDSTGTPYALKHNGTVYYYVTNLQGDVMNLVNGSGSVVATYDYDPYGKVITATGTMAAVNPLRYRGYYYDSESGMYYLQARYYDPAIGRFLNADSYSSTGQGIIGHNMFAYCGNNPVCNTDASGKLFFTALGAIVGAAFGALDALIQGETGAEFKAAVVSGAISGAVSGAAADVLTFTGATVGVAVGVMSTASAVGSIAGSIYEYSTTEDEQIAPNEVWQMFGDAASDAALGGLFAYMGGSLPSKLGKIAQKGFLSVAKNTYTREIADIGTNLAEEALATVTGGVAKFVVSAYKRFFANTIELWSD